jgi:signal transduction histidine kinase
VTQAGDSAVPLPARRAPDWVDPVLAVLAAALAVTVLVSADTGSIDSQLHPANVGSAAITAIGATGLAWRRRRPLLGLLVLIAAAAVLSATWHFTGVLPYLTMVGLYSVAAYGSRREAGVGLVLAVGCFVGLRLVGVPDLTLGDVATSAAVCVAAAAVGDAVRQRRAHARDLLLAAEARAEVASQRAVAEERLRIARELHDVVAHSMSLIAVQASVGAHLLSRDPRAAEQALDVITETSRTALTQLRSVVGLLRSAQEGPRGQDSDGGPEAQPSVLGLVSLDELVRGVRQAGLTVEVRIEGARRDVPAAVDLAAYRVVQEGLTNALKHAPHSPVTVRIAYAPVDLLVEVGADRGDGTGTHAGGPGFGLVGLRERARAVGGRLEAGTTANGGFEVRASLPTGAGA